MEANNVKAMRDALVALSAWAKAVKDNPKDKTAIECAEFVEVAVKEALSAPPRQCDMGTAEEQSRRMHEFCDSHGHGFDGQKCYSCENCRFISIDRCELAWAQLPYEN